MNNLPVEKINEETGEIVNLLDEQVVRETDDYTIVKLDNGKFEKRMKYKAISTYKPESEEEQITLYNVFNDEDHELVLPMKNQIGNEFVINEVITRPYESFDENTGSVDYGVVTSLLTEEGNFLTTSSKSVYFAITNMLGVFKLPLKIRVTGTKRENGTQINISLVGKA